MFFWRKKKNESEQQTEALKEVQERVVIEEAVEIVEEEQQEPESPAPEVQEQETPEEQSKGWLSRLTGGLSKSSSKLSDNITGVFTKRKLDAEALEELEDILIMSDMGPKTAAKIIAGFSKEKFDKEIDEAEIKNALAQSITDIVDPVAIPLDISAHKPFVMLVCGVNGAGKTTTIGKFAHDHHIKQGKKVMIAAADTFRAAAVDQLDVWAGRADVPLIKKDIGADSAAVAYEALEKATAEQVDLLMIDTAGRLQNKKNLMEELSKMIRVIKKQDETAPHAVVLVLDSTTGQNAHSQVQNFKEVVDVTGLVVTKLDGSAKGGVVVSLAHDYGLPIHAIGVGEGIEDLSAFNAKDFAKGLVG
jgi:fused signal recognition particle receptor